MGKSKGSKYYAVAHGRKPGIYNSWADCKSQTHGFYGARFKSFPSREAAENFLLLNNRGNAAAKIAVDLGRSQMNASIQSEKNAESSTKNKSYYAVACGHTPGVFDSWDECQAQIKGYSRSVFKKFSSREKADAYVEKYNQDQVRKRRKLNEDGEEAPKTPPEMSLKVEFHFDGGSRGNPGVSGAGANVVVTCTELGNTSDVSGPLIKGANYKVTNQIRHYCGENHTNNFAEYTGLLEGLKCTKRYVDEFIMMLGERSWKDEPNQWALIEVSIKGDSKLIMDQLSGYSSCNAPSCKGIREECTTLINDIRSLSKTKKKLIFVRVNHEHVYRKENTIADGLANEAMNSKRSWMKCIEEDNLISDV